MKSRSGRGARLLGAAVVLSGAWGMSAEAADLGGDCCADLEERIAELEATTARKGNRKVSLTISGWVNEAVFAWDDSRERNVYVGTNALEQDRFRFTGEAKIMNGWSAGYTLEIGVVGAASNRWDQKIDDGDTLSALTIRKSNWFIKSGDYGQVAVGLNGSATYHLLDDADITQTRNFYDAEAASVYNSRFRLNGGPGNSLSALRWTDVERGFNNSTPGQAGRRNVVRYDLPTIHGFTATTAWGEDDLGDVALAYKGEIHDFLGHDFLVAARVGYGQSTDPGTTITNGFSTTVVGGTACISGTSSASSEPGFDCKWGGAAATIMHEATGLYAYGGWGKQKVDTDNLVTANELVEHDSQVWFLQLGIEQKWCSLGKTTVFGQFTTQDTAGSNPGRTIKSDLNVWAGGVVQSLDAAAMQLYVIYQHSDGDVTSVTSVDPDGTITGARTDSIDAFQEVIMGAMIQF